MDTERFFTDLRERLDSARRDDILRYRDFFNGLKPWLDAARYLERELNRHLAHRFNVLDYLSTDEPGLSRIIADLLNPHASHGQGPFFLNVFLEILKLTESWPGLEPTQARITVERVITAGRRIDIFARVPSVAGTYCLAIENKPYAGDQKNQVKDYLKHLAREFDERFLLIYLSPNGQPPSEWSLPRTNLDRWNGRFAIMSYCGRDRSEEATNEDHSVDKFEAFRQSFSLADWLDLCHDKCRVERLRWFLRDARQFCHRTFGDHHMTTDSEARAVETFLLSNPDNLATARAVYDTWPAVRDHVCKQFLKHLQSCIKQEVEKRIPDFAGDVEVGCRYDGQKKDGSRLWLYRTSWTPYQVELPDWFRHTTISLNAENPGASGWYYGVRSPLFEKMTTDEKTRRCRLEEHLGFLNIGKKDGEFLNWAFVDDKMLDWNVLVSDLLRECKVGGGKITDYFVELIMNFAFQAIPAISEIEGEQA